MPQREITLSPSEEEVFTFLDAIGADTFAYYPQALKTPEAQALKREYPKEFRRMLWKVGFNGWAFLWAILVGGPWWYYKKRMWLKGSVLFIGLFLGGVLLKTVTLGESLTWYVVAAGVFIAMLANRDLYYFVRKNEEIWPFLSFLDNTAGKILVHMLAALVIVFSLYWLIALMPIQS